MESECLEKLKELKNEYQDFKSLTNLTLVRNRARRLDRRFYNFKKKSKLFLKQNPELKLEIDLIMKNLQNAEDDFEMNLKSLAQFFIRRLLSSLKIDDIKITEKKSGVQNGLVATVFYSNSILDTLVTSKFYIKTHQEGGISASSAASKPVNLKELFAYKALENLELGPKIDFFFDERDPVNEFYIASLEAGSNLFGPYDKVKPVNLQFKLGSEYFVSQILNPTIKDMYEKLDEKLFESLKKELTLIDIISRIFSLTDCSTNSTNFGFVTQSNVELSASIIDFRVLRFETNSSIFTEFCIGNRQFSYFNDSLISDIIVYEDLNVKLDRANLVFKKFKRLSFSKIIENSEKEVMQFISSCENEQLLKHFKSKDFLDIKEYTSSVIKNFEIFCAGLQKSQ